MHVPITWGYVLLCIIGLGSFITRRVSLDKRGLLCYLSLMPFQCISLFTILMNGQTHTGYVLSYGLHFFLLPLIFLLIFPSCINSKTLEVIFLWIKQGVLFIALYGLFLFVYKWVTGSFLEIPFLTVNYHDMHELELEKCIDRGGVFKLISTYNNGNLYGVCVLMLLPLYHVLEKSFVKRWIVKGSLILTLSRTIWIGVILYEILSYFIDHRKVMRRSAKILGSLACIALGLITLTKFFSFSSDFLLDRFLGNRIGQLDVLQYVQWISTEPFDGIYEVIYLGVLRSFGILGLIAFLFGMLFPLLLYKVEKGKGQAPIWQSSVVLGLILYLITACADGALLLIPVMCFYWFLVFLLLLSMHQSFQETSQQSEQPL